MSHTNVHALWTFLLNWIAKIRNEARQLAFCTRHKLLKITYSVALPVLAAVLLVSMICVAPSYAAPAGSRYNKDYFQNTPVISHTGERFRFYDDLIKDKLVVINFIYLSCNDICPLSTARLTEIKSRLGEVAGNNIFFYSITMDPERDSVVQLKEYADAFGIDNGWLFLTGETEPLKQLRWRLGERSRILTEHRNHLLLGNDKTGEWSRTSLYTDIDSVISKIRQLMPEWRDQKRVANAHFTTFENSKHQLLPGQALFQKACINCHSIGDGDRVGPDLKDISQRREPAWLSSYMIAPEKLRRSGDPIATKLDKDYPGVFMPNLGLSERDVKELLSYIQSRSEMTNATQQRPANPVTATQHE